MSQEVRRALEDRNTLHEELMVRARLAIDNVFGDPSVETIRLVKSLQELGERIVAQLTALTKPT